MIDLKKINLWKIFAVIFSVWYITSFVSMLVIDVFDSDISEPWRSALILISTLGLAGGSGEAALLPLFFAPFIFAVYGVLGAVFQSEKSKARRVLFGAIPCASAVYVLIILLALGRVAVPDTLFLPLIPAVITALWAIYIITSSVIEKVRSGK